MMKNIINNREEFIERFHCKVFEMLDNGKTLGNWNDAIYNPGIQGDRIIGVLGGLEYEDGYIVVIDLDSHDEEKMDGVSFWNHNLLTMETFTVSTPRNGKHLYFKATREDIELLKQSGKDKVLSRNAQAEIFYRPQQTITIPFSRKKEGEYTIEKCIELAYLPHRVVELYKEAHKRIQKRDGDLEAKKSELTEYEREVVMRELERLAWEEDTFNDYEDWTRMGMMLKNSGFEVDDWQRISYTESQEECRKKWQTFKDDGGLNFGSIIYNYIPEFNDAEWKFDKIEDLTIENALEKFEFLYKIKAGSKTAILDTAGDNKLEFRKFEDVKACYSSKDYRMKYPELDKRTKHISFKDVDGINIWWKESRTIEKIEMFPYERFGVLEKDGKPVFNDWQESPYRKVGNGTTELFWKHIKENICQNDETCFQYFKMWVYQMLLCPGKPIGKAVCVVGEQGCGKTIIGDILAECFHETFRGKVSTTNELLSNFDSNYKSKIFLQIEEAFWAGEQRTGIWEKMKDLLTAKTYSMERKYFDRINGLKNRIHVFMTSNRDFIAPKEQGDRRYFILKCSNGWKGEGALFKRMAEDMENGGIHKLIQEAFAHKEEVEGFRFDDIPATAIGLQNQLEAGDISLSRLIELINEFNDRGEDGEEADGEEPFPSIEKSPLIELNGGNVCLITSRLLEMLQDEGFLRDGYKRRTTESKIASYFCTSSRMIKQKSIGKGVRGYRFESLQSMKDEINKKVFNGSDIFKIVKDER